MTELISYLKSKPWWNARFMWGEEVAQWLVIDAVWHSNFAMADLEDLDEDVLA